MRASLLFARTLRDAPAEAEAPSHRLLVRAACVRQVVSGVYTMLPLGLRVLRRIEGIVREEMDRAGAQEVRMPILVPSEPWRLTGRWDAYGDEMFRLTDRAGRELGLTPTAEEVVTPLVAAELGSWRDLPVNLYQIGWKYRDELRARGGLIRGREFLMKDAYSFDRDPEGVRASYSAMVDAYRRIFDRCGLTHVMVEADPGLMGGEVNHEFMAPADVGEDRFAWCEACDYAANVDAATRGSSEPPPADDVELEPMAEVHTPGRPGIQDVVEFLGRPATEMLKCMLYDAGGRTVAVLLPGDREINEGKLARALAPEGPVRMFGDEDFAASGFVKGYIGPQGIPEDVLVLADPSVGAGTNWITGANRADHHVAGASLGRDFRVDRWEAVVRVVDGDPCPRCGSRLRIRRSIEVGHCFQLGTRYSIPLAATFVDRDGNMTPYHMGCYGIGITRVMAAVAEEHGDEAGLAWPKAIAPFDAVVVPTNMDLPEVVEAAERVYAELRGGGLDAVIDDRRATAGVKFADADLIGYPVQVVVGRRGLASGHADFKVRATGERSRVPLDDAVGRVAELLEDAP
jgi:prolyl-tRNA synthetase